MTRISSLQEYYMYNKPPYGIITGKADVPDVEVLKLINKRTINSTRNAKNKEKGETTHV